MRRSLPKARDRMYDRTANIHFKEAIIKAKYFTAGVLVAVLVIAAF